MSVLGGRYRIVREIGHGGMGQVFQAVDTETGRSVAAKVMIATSDDNLESLLRFQQEGAVLSTLKHPNIVEVYGTFLEEHTSCIIMELLEGRSLAQILRAEQLLLPRIKHLMEQVAAAIAYAHGRAIVHRDIKPDNIMVVGDDQVKVTDFGIARVLRTGATLNTMAGMSIGTPLYMAPEQIEGQKVDGRADIYSAGAVLYQMVAGRPPFEGDDPLTIAFKHVHKAPQPPSQVNADVPEDWEAVILKALAKDPGDRFQTAAAFEEAIQSLSLDGLGTVTSQRPASPAERPAPPVEHRTPPPTRPSTQAPRTRTGDAPTVAPTPEDFSRWPAVEAEPRVAAQATAPQAAPEVPVDADGANGQPTALPHTMPMPASELQPREATQTGLRRAPVEDTRAPVRPAPVSTPQAATAQKPSGAKLPVIIGGAGAAIVLIAVAAFFLLNKGSSSTPKSSPASSIALSVAGARNGATFTSGRLVTLRWTVVPGAIYHLQVAHLPADPTDAVVFAHARTMLTEATSYSLRVVGRQEYYWRVQAQVNGKWQPYTPSNHFAVAAPSIAVPAIVSPRSDSSTTASRVRLCWTGVKNAVGYRLDVNRRARNVQSTCHVLSVHPGSYHWRVAALVRGARIYRGVFVRGFFTVRAKPAPTPRPTPKPAPKPVSTQAPAATSPPTYNSPQPTQAPAATSAPSYNQPSYTQPTQAPVNNNPPSNSNPSNPSKPSNPCQVSCG